MRKLIVAVAMCAGFAAPAWAQFETASVLFNVFDKQTGFNIQPSVHDSAFGQARNFFDPRRLQVAARLQF